MYRPFNCDSIVKLLLLLLLFLLLLNLLCLAVAQTPLSVPLCQRVQERLLSSRVRRYATSNLGVFLLSTWHLHLLLLLLNLLVQSYLPGRREHRSRRGRALLVAPAPVHIGIRGFGFRLLHLLLLSVAGRGESVA